MRFPGHVVRMGRCKGTGNFCRKTLKDLEDLRVVGRIILKLLLYIEKMRFWTRLICSGQWPLASVNTTMELRVPQRTENLLTSLATDSFAT